MQSTAGQPGSALTKRELDVLELIALGLTNADIAQQLSLSRRTVDTHVEHILGKLGAPTRTRAVLEAGRAQLLRGARAGLCDRPYNLPVQRTSFVGRITELSEVTGLLAKSRLVTIVGTGGIGKTRLAVQVGADLLDAYSDGIWLADLAKISTADSVASEIALALGVKPRGFSQVVDHVLAHLKSKQLLLIIDNCEHVAKQASHLIELVLKACPFVTVLATAREDLHQSGEQVYRLGPLEMPDRSDLSAYEASQYSAVALFVERARAADARFTLSDADVAAVVEVCRQLDGMPLALELAAGRVTALNICQLAKRLHEQFRLLASHIPTVPARHQTMQATLDWSYKLLTEGEQQLFRCLAIFQGGWTLEAVSTVAGFFPDEVATLDAIAPLIDKSLVTVDFRAQSQRYRFLEPVRQYALTLLRQHAEFDVNAFRHAEYFAELAHRVNELWLKVPEAERLASIEEELDNIRAALDWTLTERKKPVLGAQLAADLWTFWFARHQHEGKKWLEIAQDALSYETERELAVSLALARARLFAISDIGEMLAACEQALEPARALGNSPLLRRTLFYHGVALLMANRLHEAEPFLDEVLALCEQSGDHYRTVYVLVFYNKLNRRLGRYDRARESNAYMESECCHLETQLDPNAGLLNCERASMALLDGHLDRAIELCREAHRVAREIKDLSQDVHAQYGVAAYLLLAGSPDEALVHGIALLKMSREELFTNGIGPAFQVLAGVLTQRGEHEQAARLIGYAHVRFAQQRHSPDAFVDVDSEWFLGPLRDRLGAARLADLMAEGAAWSEEHAVDEALTFATPR